MATPTPLKALQASPPISTESPPNPPPDRRPWSLEPRTEIKRIPRAPRLSPEPRARPSRPPAVVPIPHPQDTVPDAPAVVPIPHPQDTVPDAPAVVPIPHPQDTLPDAPGLAKTLDPDIPFQTHNPADGRLSRHSTLPTPIAEYASGRQRASDIQRSTLVAPDEDIYMHPNTVYKCLIRTFKHAKEEREKAKLTARTAKWSMLAVAGAQVLLGALTTGLSALRLDGQKSAAATTALGILSTVSGSYLAHIRATSEPEKSIMRIHKLDAFIRRLDAFLLDHAYDPIDNHKSEIENYRHELEVILAEASSLNTSTRPSTNSAVEDKMKSKQKENV